MLSPRDIVILDGLNYIKGWRYQLYCEAKNLRTPNVVLQIGCSIERAKGVNQARIARQEEQEQSPEGGDEGAVRNEGTEEDAYEPGNWENLVFRYEEPNAMNRWDSPLFTLIWDDDEARTQEVFGSLWEAIAGDARKVIKPNQVALQRGADADGDYLYALDRETQDIVKKILEQQHDDVVGIEVRIPGDGASREELALQLPGKTVGLPQLQRYRRAFLALNRGGIGFEAGGNLAVKRIREGFVGYLKDVFGRDE